MAKYLGTGRLIIDDNDIPWFYDVDEGKLKCLYDDTLDGGFDCNTWDSAKDELSGGGYVYTLEDLDHAIYTNEPGWGIIPPEDAPNPYKDYFKQLLTVTKLRDEVHRRVEKIEEDGTERVEEAVSSLAHQLQLLEDTRTALLVKYISENKS